MLEDVLDLQRRLLDATAEMSWMIKRIQSASAAERAALQEQLDELTATLLSYADRSARCSCDIAWEMRGSRIEASRRVVSRRRLARRLATLPAGFEAGVHAEQPQIAFGEALHGRGVAAAGGWKGGWIEIGVDLVARPHHRLM